MIRFRQTPRAQSSSAAPTRLSLEGTIEGENVDVDLTRANGCEIERFDAAVPLLQALYPDYEPGGSLAP